MSKNNARPAVECSLMMVFFKY